MKLHEKSHAFNLYACTTSECNVVTFIKQIACPACGMAGAHIRYPAGATGQPMDPRERSYSSEDE
jgi:hypothetical protein